MPELVPVVSDPVPGRVFLRRDESQRWAETNRVLANGEPGYATDTGVLKVGDGQNGWNQLPAIGGAGAGSSAEVWEQTLPLASWAIPHGLGRRPVVAIYMDGELVDADILATSTTVTVTLPEPMVGTAVLT